MIELIPTSDSVEHGVRVDALPGAQFLDHDPVVLIAGLPGLWLGPAAPYASQRRGKFGEPAASALVVNTPVSLLVGWWWARGDLNPHDLTATGT